MIPGKGPARLSEETQASATTLSTVKSDIVILTGTTQIETIPPPFGGRVWGLMITLIPVDGGLTLGNSGNIATTLAIVQNRACSLVWSVSRQKWHIDSGA
jgi:hypothetical protein